MDLVRIGKKKLRETVVHQKAFDDIKKSMDKETILNYSNIIDTFETYTDASDRHLGTIVSESGKPFAFYSRKLSNVQRNYTNSDQELLNIVDSVTICTGGRQHLPTTVKENQDKQAKDRDLTQKIKTNPSNFQKTGTIVPFKKRMHVPTNLRTRIPKNLELIP